MNDRCANCHRDLEPWSGDPKNRPPCPNCGATGRIVELSASLGGRDEINAEGEASVRAFQSSGDAVVTPAPIEVKADLPTPTVRVTPSALEEAISDLQADHARLFLVTDLGGGIFHAQVRDERGHVLGEGAGDDLEDALLELAEHLLD